MRSLLRRIPLMHRLVEEGRRHQTALVLLWIEVVGRIPSHAVRRALGRATLRFRFPASVHVYRWRELRCPDRIEIGENTIVGSWSTLDGRGGIRIGRNVNISSEVAIWTAQHDLRSSDFAYVSAPVSIGDRAWISFRATILPGVRVGEGAVVAANAVVSRDVEPYAIVGGAPARKVGERPRDLVYEFDNAEALPYL